MKLSIITINYNNAIGLKKTIKSVLSQTSQEFEYIIVDGGSNDPSCEVMNNKQIVINGKTELNGISITCISEPDKGIYNAMNKGISLAKGDYVHFLNSGDWLVDSEVVSNMLSIIQKDTDILVGNVIFVREDGKVRYATNDKEVSGLTFYRSTLQHTSAYIRRALFDKYGLYDENLKIVSDWKWYVNTVILNEAIVEFSDVYVTYFDTTGISSTNLTLDKKERQDELAKMYPPLILADYEKYRYAIEQYNRLQRYKPIFFIFWFVERVLFKFEKWHRKMFGWKKIINTRI